MKPDFSGYVTRNDIRCTDGLIIRNNAFQHQDKQKIPVFWRHRRNEVSNVLGFAELYNLPDGVYADVYLNDTPNGKHAKAMVEHGDINALSIFADSLKKRGNDVLYGNIKEVSLVLKGANPEAYIDHINLSHGDEDYDDGSGIIYTGLTFDNIELSHEDKKTNNNKSELDNYEDEEKDMVEEKTIEELYNEQPDDVKNLIHYFVGAALEADLEQEDDDDDQLEHDGYSVNYNIFEDNNGEDSVETLSHEQTAAIFADAARYDKSLKESVLQHAEEYGITDINFLFPDAKTLRDDPDLYKRRTEWVTTVLSETSHSPFSKVKSLVADITLDSARAKGYIKGNLKKDEFFKLLKRETSPATIYKKQKLDRDDILDITSFDVVAFLKKEMRLMLDEEIARAILIGDGREIDNEDHIADPRTDNTGKGIRSILHDHDFYSHKISVPSNTVGGNLVETIIRGMNEFRGTGTPTLFTSRLQMTDMLLEKDKLGRRIYSSITELANTLQVSRIVPVDVFNDEPDLIGIVVTLRDYNIGADKGGELSFFDDFDIDYNQNKYLLESRISGSLTLPKSALVFKRGTGTQVVPIAPTFNSTTNVITIPSVTGVKYMVEDQVVTGTVTITKDTTVEAIPDESYYFVAGVITTWTFEHNEG